jgi:protein lifeguard
MHSDQSPAVAHDTASHPPPPRPPPSRLQTRFDFTVFNGVLMCLLTSLLVFGLLNIWFRNRIVALAIAWVGALLFSAYVVVDTQAVVGGKGRAVVFGEDEYIGAALSLYLDIVNLFIYLLRIVGSMRR